MNLRQGLGRSMLLLAALLALSWTLAAQDSIWKATMAAARSAYDDARYTEAKNLYRVALQQAEAFGPRDLRLAESQTSLGRVVETLGDYEEALALYRLATSIHRTTRPDNDPELARSFYRVGHAYLLMRQYDRAQEFLTRSLSSWEGAGGQHADQALTLDALAELHRTLRRFEEAEKLYQRSRKLRKTVLGKDAPELARSLQGLATLAVDRHDYKKADSFYREALALQEAALVPDHPAVARTLAGLGSLRYRQRDFDAARELYERALAIWERTGVADPRLLDVLSPLGTLYAARAQYDELERLYLRLLPRAEATLGPEHATLGRLAAKLAALYTYRNKHEQAEPLFRRAIAIQEKALGPMHPEVGKLLRQYAALLRELGREAKARELDLRVQAMREVELQTAGTPGTRWQALMSNAAQASRDRNPAEAEALYREALLAAEAFGPNDSRYINTARALAGALFNRQPAQAERLYLQLLAQQERVLGRNHPGLVEHLRELAVFYGSRRKLDKIEQIHKRMLKIQEKAFGKTSTQAADMMTEMAFHQHLIQGDLKKAESLYRRALSAYEKAEGRDSPRAVGALRQLGTIHKSHGRFVQAEKAYKRTLAIQEKALGSDNYSLVESLKRLAWLYRELKKYGEAEPLLRRRLTLEERQWGPDHDSVYSTIEELADNLREQKKFAQAERFYQRRLAQYERRFGRTHFSVAHLLQKYAVVVRGLGREVAARAMEDRARAILRSGGQ